MGNKFSKKKNLLNKKNVNISKDNKSLNKKNNSIIIKEYENTYDITEKLWN